MVIEITLAKDANSLEGGRQKFFPDSPPNMHRHIVGCMWLSALVSFNNKYFEDQQPKHEAVIEVFWDHKEPQKYLAVVVVVVVVVTSFSHQLVYGMTVWCLYFFIGLFMV